MEINPVNRARAIKLLSAGVVVVAFLVATVCSLFVRNINRITKEETERYLSEISSGVIETVKVKMDGTLTSLRSTVQTYEKIKEDGQDVEAYLESKAAIYGFSSISIVNMDGTSKEIHAKNMDLSKIPGVQKALKGEEIVSSTAITPADGVGKCIYYAVPIKQDKKIVGAMIVWNTTKQMRENLEIERFAGEGFSQIVDQEGDLVIKSSNSNEAVSEMNFFDDVKKHGSVLEGDSLKQMKKRMKNYKSGMIYFQLDGIERTLNYRPINQEGLYLFSVVPTKVANHQFNHLTHQAIGVNVFIVVLFSLLTGGIIFISNKNNKNLMRMAFVDPVTGGYSRMRFHMESERKIKEGLPGEYMIVSVDISKFKLINDIFGSESGDRILRYVYQEFKKFISNDELLSRVSADHFEILIHTRSQDEIIKKLEQISKSINRFNENLTQKYYLTLSVGIYHIKDHKMPFIYIQDRAIAARKEQEKTYVDQFFTCVFYNGLERKKMLLEKDMENKMNDALENHEFVVYLQPKVELKHNEIAGAEALVRWKDKKSGLIPPNDFIPLFEKNGFIVKLDLYVFEQVCQQLQQWIQEGKRVVPVSVNLSRIHLDNPDFLQKFIEVQKKYHIPSNLLEIEMTETVAYEKQEMFLQATEKIHEAGFGCSMDDFGSGYSSLNTLKDIKVDTVKLDKAFFSEGDAENEREKAVIESVISMAKKLHMKTVSEGVEIMEQVEFLKSIQCDMIQGYVFSKPLPMEVFEKKLNCFNK